MTDIADTASDYQTRHNAEALSRVVRYTGQSATHCDECADPIPEGRREAVPGCRLCTGCQDIEDQRQL